jgi:hypothetical protein
MFLKQQSDFTNHTSGPNALADFPSYPDFGASKFEFARLYCTVSNKPFMEVLQKLQ